MSMAVHQGLNAPGRAAPGDQFGVGVAVTPYKNLAVTAPREDQASAKDAGVVDYTYLRSQPPAGIRKPTGYRTPS